MEMEIEAKWPKSREFYLTSLVLTSIKINCFGVLRATLRANFAANDTVL
jgi:hypothetical protein